MENTTVVRNIESIQDLIKVKYYLHEYYKHIYNIELVITNIDNNVSNTLLSHDIKFSEDNLNKVNNTLDNMILLNLEALDLNNYKIQIIIK